MKAEFEKCMAGEPFDGTSPEIAEMALRNKRLLRQLRDVDYAGNEAKQRIFKTESFWNNGHFTSEHFFMICKQALFTLQNQLLSTTNKPCLYHKQGLFERRQRFRFKTTPPLVASGIRNKCL